MRGRRLSIGWDGYSQNMEYNNMLYNILLLKSFIFFHVLYDYMTVTVMCDILVTDLCNITL